MAKNSRSKAASARKKQDQAKGQQKKQAKKEAKAMLAIERVKDLLEEAHDKLAKAQARVEARTAQLRNLEGKLATFRSTSPSLPTSGEAPDSGFNHQGSQSDTQEAPTGAEMLSLNSSESETQTAGTSVSTSASTAARNPAASDSSNGTTTPGASATPAKTGARPRTTRASTPRKASPVKASSSAAQPSSSRPARRTATRKPTNTAKTTPEASDSNKSE